MICPYCQKEISPSLIASVIGAKGGRKKGYKQDPAHIKKMVEGRKKKKGSK